MRAWSGAPKAEIQATGSAAFRNKTNVPPEQQSFKYEVGRMSRIGRNLLPESNFKLSIFRGLTVKPRAAISSRR